MVFSELITAAQSSAIMSVFHGGKTIGSIAHAHYKNINKNCFNAQQDATYAAR